MGRYILKQPNGLYCVWSSIVDAPIIYNATKEDLYKKDYLNITRPAFGEYLKADVDYAISCGYEFDGKDKPAIIYNMSADDVREFLADIGSKYTIDDFWVAGYSEDDETEEVE